MAKTVDGEDAVAGAAIGMEEAEAAEEGLEAVAVAAEVRDILTLSICKFFRHKVHQLCLQDMAADSSTMARVPRWE